MKVEDLMLGDWVQVEGIPLRVGGLSNYDIYVDLFRGNESEVYSQIWADELDSIEPIPLTPEILEKNGFKKGIGFGYSETYPTYCWGYHNDVTDLASIEVTFYDKPIGGVKVLVRMETNSLHPCGFNTFHSCDLENVHELQHALRLCGIEKEIVL